MIASPSLLPELLVCWAVSIVAWEAIDRRKSLRGGIVSLVRITATTMLFAFGLAIVGNPFGAVLGSVLLASGLVFGSNLKLRLVDEPLVFTDLIFAFRALRNPRLCFLYIPPLPRLLMVLSLAAFILIATISSQGAVRVVGIIVFCGLGFVVVTGHITGSFDRLLLEICPKPDLKGDVCRWGVIATLCMYAARWDRSAPALTRDPLRPIPVPCCGPTTIVVIECESFADPSDLGLAVPPLPNLTAAGSRALFHGRLECGTNTMRTEFAVLTGQTEESIGFDLFDPYLRVYQTAADTALAKQMSAAGFHCEFIHPYDRHFFRRDIAIPALGFDVFLDEAAAEFATAERAGRYISDREVGRVLLDRISKSVRPSLFYVVTMENHGPWRDADNYLEHLNNSDRLLGMVIKGLDDLGRDYVLAFFGDHRPALLNVASRGKTPFVILRRVPPASPVLPMTASAAELNKLLITAITKVI